MGNTTRKRHVKQLKKRKHSVFIYLLEEERLLGSEDEMDVGEKDKDDGKSGGSQEPPIQTGSISATTPTALAGAPPHSTATTTTTPSRPKLSTSAARKARRKRAGMRKQMEGLEVGATIPPVGEAYQPTPTTTRQKPPRTKRPLPTPPSNEPTPSTSKQEPKRVKGYNEAAQKALFLHITPKKEDGLSEEAFKALKKDLTQIVYKAAGVEIHIKRVSLVGGIGVVECADEKTQTVISDLLRATSGGEKYGVEKASGPPTDAKIKLVCWLEELGRFNFHKFKTLVQAQNKSSLDPSSWAFEVFLPRGEGGTLFFRANEASYKQLVGMGMRAYYGLGTVKFRIPEQRGPETVKGPNIKENGGSGEGGPEGGVPLGSPTPGLLPRKKGSK